MWKSANRIVLSGPVDHTMFSHFTDGFFSHIDGNPKDPLTIVINSDGGEPEVALGIYDLMQSVNTPIFTVANGRAHSSAFIIMLGTEAKKRLSYPHTRFMLHKGVQKDLPLSGDKELEACGKELREINVALMRIVSKNTHLSSQKVRMTFFNNTAPVYFNVQEAINWGFVSEVVKKTNYPTKTQPKSKKFLLLK